MSVADKIKKNLSEGLDIAHLEVVNQSHLHAGHSGDDGSGESHFKLIVESVDFSGKSRVQQHKMIHSALGDALMHSIHAIAIQASIPK